MSEPTAARDPNQPFVLIVEDDATMRDILKNLVEEMGVQVQEAHDSAEALAFLRSAPRPPGLIIFDWAMPRNGESFVQEARELLGSDVPLLLLSGLSPREVGAIGQRLGIKAISKPFDLDAFEAEVRALLQLS